MAQALFHSSHSGRGRRCSLLHLSSRPAPSPLRPHSVQCRCRGAPGQRAFGRAGRAEPVAEQPHLGHHALCSAPGVVSVATATRREARRGPAWSGRRRQRRARHVERRRGGIGPRVEEDGAAKSSGGVDGWLMMNGVSQQSAGRGTARPCTVEAQQSAGAAGTVVSSVRSSAAHTHVGPRTCSPTRR